MITNAVSCGTMFRGLEIILRGRDRAMRGRSLNVSAASVLAYTPWLRFYAIEDAIGIKVPDNANIIRNIMLATLWCHDHLVHFYQLAGMDWIDVLDALKADPRKPPNWRKVSPLGRNHPWLFLRRTKPPEKIC